jgi:hypothetical protein
MEVLLHHSQEQLDHVRMVADEHSWSWPSSVRTCRRPSSLATTS